MRILETDKQIQRKIDSLLFAQIDKAIRSKRQFMLQQIQNIVRRAIASSPEISSLSGGLLKADFGLTNDPSDEIIEAVAQSVEIEIKSSRPANSGFTFSVAALIQPETYSNLLSSSFANQEIEDGGSLPWLEWLLTAGDSILITGFGIEYKSGSGRTGRAKMVENMGPFRVNPLFSGTTDNNFITRSIKPHLDEISKILAKELS